jgi:hypothetical protein
MYDSTSLIIGFVIFLSLVGSARLAIDYLWLTGKLWSQFKTFVVLLLTRPANRSGR